MRFARAVVLPLLALISFGCNTGPDDPTLCEVPPADFGKDMPAAAAAAFYNAERLWLYALNPAPSDQPQAENTFHGFEVLRQTTLSNARERHELLSAIAEGIRSSDGKVAACFMPRHGLRAVDANGQQYDLQICYECLSMRVWDGDSRLASILTARGVESCVSQVFRNAGLPIAP